MLQNPAPENILTIYFDATEPVPVELATDFANLVAIELRARGWEEIELLQLGRGSFWVQFLLLGGASTVAVGSLMGAAGLALQLHEESKKSDTPLGGATSEVMLRGEASSCTFKGGEVRIELKYDGKARSRSSYDWRTFVVTEAASVRAADRGHRQNLPTPDDPASLKSEVFAREEDTKPTSLESDAHADLLGDGIVDLSIDNNDLAEGPQGVPAAKGREDVRRLGTQSHNDFAKDEPDSSELREADWESQWELRRIIEFDENDYSTAPPNKEPRLFRGQLVRTSMGAGIRTNEAKLLPFTDLQGKIIPIPAGTKIWVDGILDKKEIGDVGARRLADVLIPLRMGLHEN